MNPQPETAEQPTARPRIRVVSRGKANDIIATGGRKRLVNDAYAGLLDAGWGRLLVFMTSVYFIINLTFAAAYYADIGDIENAHANSFADAFFFSVQTLATIGYGHMAPNGIIANLLVTLEAMLGFAYYGLFTGLMFAKFSRPTARVLFSETAVITTHNGEPHFMMRLANERHNRIVNAQAKLTEARMRKPN